MDETSLPRHLAASKMFAAATATRNIQNRIIFWLADYLRRPKFALASARLTCRSRVESDEQETRREQVRARFATVATQFN